jgi:hypothetical protein
MGRVLTPSKLYGTTLNLTCSRNRTPPSVILASLSKSYDFVPVHVYTRQLQRKKVSTRGRTPLTQRLRGEVKCRSITFMGCEEDCTLASLLRNTHRTPCRSGCPFLERFGVRSNGQLLLPIWFAGYDRTQVTGGQIIERLTQR